MEACLQNEDAHMHPIDRNSVSWDDFSPDEALAWCRVFFDFPPEWPGASFMNFAYRAYREGKAPGLLGWAPAARSARDIGLTPDLLYTLQLVLSVIDPAQYERHPDRMTPRKRPGRALDFAVWSLWPELVASGMTPLSAARSILSGGQEGPRGLLIDPSTGRVVSTDDA
jgi:hypothetical protein